MAYSRSTGGPECTLLIMAYPRKTDRERILAAVLEQVEQEGDGSVAIRTVAARLKLAPTALYHYFKDFAALEAAIAEEVNP